jgi:hypothetical protein
MNRLAIIATIAAAGLSACQRGQDQAQADTTARDLTLAPTESTTAMQDVPDRQTNPPAAPPRTPPPSVRPPAARPPAPPPAPARPATRTLSSGAKFDVAATDTISSRTAKIGDTFTARVIEDVRNTAGQVVIPAGSTINGKITEVKPAPNPRTPGTLTLDVASVTVGGNTYPIDAAVDSVETVHKGRGVTTGDAAKVGAGAAAGAILGRVIGGNSKGTVIGGVVGGIAGAGVATTTKDSDIVLPAGAHIIVRLTKDLTVSGS